MFFDNFLTKIFGTANERLIKRLMPMVALISALEADMKQLSDEQLRAKTAEFRERIAAKVAHERIELDLPMGRGEFAA